MSGLQIASGASQAESRVWVRRVVERSARKNEFEFCRRSDTGTQDWNVALLRKLEKKVGQDEVVKLVPIEVSNGEGRGVVTTVTEGLIEVETAVPEIAVEVSVAMANEVAAAEEVVEEEEDVVEAAPESDVEVASSMLVATLVGTTLSCLRWMCMSRIKGGSVRSICISPRAASSWK